jgi:peroxiredoxin
MTEERFLRGFRAFDGAVAPDPVFAERLFVGLAGELGFRPGAAAAPAPVPGTSVRRAFRLDWRPLPPAQMRLVYLAATVALLAAALAGSAFVASRLIHASPLDIVRRSQAVVADPPPFVLVYRNATGQEATLAYDGKGTWRGDDPDGSYSLWDGSRRGGYNAQTRTWGVGDVPDPRPPFALLMDTWGWTSTSVPGALGNVTAIECADAQWVEEATVAGRAADRVRCPSWYGTELWIDRESALVLKYVAGPDAPGWAGEMPPDVVMRGIEAVSLDLSPPKAASFSWDGPVGAYDENNPPPSTVLAVGAPVLAISTTTVDGAPIALPARGRPTAVLFTSTRGGRAGRMNHAFTTAAAAHPGVATAMVFDEMAGTVAGYRDLHPTTVALAGDWKLELWQAWGTNIPGTLVLVDEEGTAVRLGYEELDAAGIESLLGALEAGAPLPEVAPVTPVPAPSFVPPPSEAPVGAALPAWTGRLADGGTFDAASLAGRPYVLTWFARSECEACAVDVQLHGFRAAETALRARAAFVLRGDGEETPGTTSRQMARLGITAPVVMDWDGTIEAAISEALSDYMAATIVVDAEGRMAAAFETFPGEAAIAEVLDRLEAAAAPAP